MSLTFQYEILPNQTQRDKLWETSRILNRVYNSFVELEQKTFKESNKYLNWIDLNNRLVSMKLEDPSLKQVYSQVLRQVSKRIHFAYMLFFKRVVIHPPKVRDEKWFYTITYPQFGYSIRGNRLFTSAYGPIKIRMHRPIKGNIKQISISYDGKWHLNVVTDHQYTDKSDINQTKVALDLGTKDLYTTELGEKMPPPQHLKYYDNLIDNLKTRRSKFKNGSRMFRHLSKIIHKLYVKKVNKTKDYLHKVSHHLSTQYDTVIVEDLNTKTMSESKVRGRNRQLRNTSIGKFVSMLEYKVKRVIKVNPMYTSQTCCLCHHHIEKKLPLSNRTFKCPHCGLKLDRDHNAAVNILQLGYAMSVGPFRKRNTILDLPELMYIDQDTKHCLEQTIGC